MKRRLFGILLSFALMIGMMPVLSRTAYAKQGGVPYIGSDGVQHYADATAISSSGVFDGEWYYVSEDTDIGAIDFTNSDGVNLILADDTTLTVTGRKNETGVWADQSLTIYGQDSGTGKLVTYGYYGIISVNGTVTINGGSVEATGAEDLEGVFADNVTINGGTLTAKGKTGIASGSANSTVTINGGTVIAEGKDNGISTFNGTVSINGGTLTASGGTYGIEKSTVLLDKGMGVNAGDAAPGTDVTGTNDWQNKKWVQIAEAYPLWVGGARVTKANESDVLNDGKVSYDDSTKTLTLNDADIDGDTDGSKEYYDSDHSMYTGIHGTILTTLSSLTVNVKSDSTVIGPSNGQKPYSYGIYSRNDLTITGDGILNASGGNYGYNAGVCADNIIIDGNVYATGVEPTRTNSATTDSGIQAVTSITINEDAELIAAGSNDRGYAIDGSSTAILINKIAGTGWTNAEGTEGKKNIEINTAGQSISSLSGFKKVKFPAEPEPTPAQKVTVSFDPAGGSVVESQTIEKGSKAIKPADPTKDGYTFDGWYKGDTAFNFNTAINENTTLTAHWKKNETPTSVPVSIQGAKVVLSAAAYAYNGKTRKPSIRTIGGMSLKEGTDYTVRWSNPSSKNVGAYKVTITGKGNYTGTTSASYKINPKGTSLKKLSGTKKAATIRWKKQAAKMSKSRITGYQIQLATDKKFTKNKKTVTVKGYNKVSKKVKKLKGKKKYYVRIRTYKTVGGKKYYSSWSKTKTVKTR